MDKAHLGVALSFFMVVLLVVLYQRFILLRRERLNSHRYRLFSLRDKLVLLVAEEKVKEEDSAFQFLYTNLDRFIPHIRPLSFSQFVKALNASPLADEDVLRKEVVWALQHSHPDVRMAAKELFATLSDILFDMSLFVRIAVGMSMIGYRLTEMCQKAIKEYLSLASHAFRRHVLAHLFHTENAAYELYRHVRESIRILHASMCNTSVRIQAAKSVMVP